MSDNLLTLRERVSNALTLGESHFREFKSALEGPPAAKVPRDVKSIKRDIAETLVGFANADGGELLVGVEDDGTVTGLRHSEVQLQALLDAWKTHVHADTPLPTPRVSRLPMNDGLVLFFAVEKSTSSVHLTSDGRCLQRRDRETVPVATERIAFERQERASRECDRQFVDGATVSDLDLSLIEFVGEKVAPSLSPEKVLQMLDLAEYAGGTLRLRRAALLLMSSNVNRWHPRCDVRVLRVSGTELKSGRDYNAHPDTRLSNNILKLLVEAWEEIRNYLTETRLGPDGRFAEQVRYPEDACREALTNALAHRDYSIEGRGVEVLVFDNRLEVHSPGGLLSTVTIEGIRSQRGVHQSRNTMIARTLREAGYMREMGEGFRRIYALMREHDLVEPDLSSDSERFVVLFRYESVFSQEDRRWIDGYSQFHLERDEEKIILLGRDGHPLSVNDIMNAVSLVDTEDYRALIERLQQKGLIQSARRAAGTGVAKRNQPRWHVVPPRQAAANLAEVMRVASEIATSRDSFSRADFQRIKENLSRENPFRAVGKIERSLQRLDLVDSSGRLVGDLLSPAVDGASADAPSASVHGLSAKPRAGLESRPVGDLSRTLFLRGDLEEVSEHELRSLLQAYGEVLGLRQVSRRQAGRSRSFFVDMSSKASAEAVLRNLNGHLLNGRVLTVEWARSRTHHQGAMRAPS